MALQFKISPVFGEGLLSGSEIVSSNYVLTWWKGKAAFQVLFYKKDTNPTHHDLVLMT